MEKTLEEKVAELEKKMAALEVEVSVQPKLEKCYKEQLEHGTKINCRIELDIKDFNEQDFQQL